MPVVPFSVIENGQRNPAVLFLVLSKPFKSLGKVVKRLPRQVIFVAVSQTDVSLIIGSGGAILVPK